MFKKILLLSLFFVGCTLKAPTDFSEKALNDTMFNMENKELPFKEILKMHKGKKVLLNVWASWCRDCIVAMPKLKELQANNPHVAYLFISSDRNTSAWKKALEKYNIKGTHYFMKNGMNSDFGDFLNSNWIPRYLVINENGFVDLFKAKKITDNRIVNALKK
tara:strand:+ start:74 stop:559 length:486 start_codon:yes stop_codon:yes gene_type:complete